MNSLFYSVLNIEKSSQTPLVLLHGFLESSTMWDHVQFPNGYPLLTVDLPGHGKSNQPESISESIEEMAKAVIQTIDEIGIERYHLIGHSMGGYVGLELKRMDSRLDKIMLLNSNFWSDSPQKVQDRMRVAEIVQTNKSHFIYEVIPNLFLNPEKFDADVKGLISEALSMSPEAIAAASIAMSGRRDYTEFVRENSKDFTVIQGSEDPIVPLIEMRDLLSGTDATYIELAEVGHMAHFEARSKLNEIVLDFLK